MHSLFMEIVSVNLKCVPNAVVAIMRVNTVDYNTFPLNSSKKTELNEDKISFSRSSATQDTANQIQRRLIIYSV